MPGREGWRSPTARRRPEGPRVQNPTRRRVLAAGLAGTVLGLVGGRPRCRDDPADGRGDHDDTAAATDGRGPGPAAVRPVARAGGAGPVPGGDRRRQRGPAGRRHAQQPPRLRRHPRRRSSAPAPSTGATRRCTRSWSASSRRPTSPPWPRPPTTSSRPLVATHTELLRSIQNLDGARLIASILIVEARHCAVLADLAGGGDDLDALFENEAEPLVRRPASGG